MAATEDFETITVRIPARLKQLVEQTAEARSLSLTALVREALEEVLRPSGRVYQQPGLSSAFDEFVAKAADGPVLILVIDERTGHRSFFHGSIDHDLTNTSLIAIKRFNEAPWIIPRRDVVAWFEGEAPARVRALALTLERQGWARRSAA